MTIVCATRFSEESARAVEAAVAIARRRREPLRLVHVLPGGLLQALRGQFSDPARTALEDEAARLEAQGLTVTTELLQGSLGEALAGCCARVEASLLVVGDTARRTPALLAGSLDRLVYSVEAPVLVVRDPRPFQAWSEERPLKVLLAFDRTASSAVARDWLGALAKVGPLALVATQLYWPLEECEARHLDPKDALATIPRLIAEELEKEVASLPPNVKVTRRPTVAEGQVAAQLLAIAAEEGADLVVLGTHRKRALERLFSISHAVLLQAPMSVACVPQSTSVPYLARSPKWQVGVVVSDLGESGARAVAWGCSLLAQGQALHVVHVPERPVDTTHEAPLVKRLTASLPPEAGREGLKLQVQVLTGEPEEALRRFVLAVDADVVVLGAAVVPRAEEADEGVFGPQVMRQWQLMQHLLQSTQRPVLVTPPLKA